MLNKIIDNATEVIRYKMLSVEVDKCPIFYFLIYFLIRMMESMSSTLDFTIPLNRTDLRNKSGVDQYAVDEILPKRLLATKIQGEYLSYEVISIHFKRF